MIASQPLFILDSSEELIEKRVGRNSAEARQESLLTGEKSSGIDWIEGSLVLSF